MVNWRRTVRWIYRIQLRNFILIVTIVNLFKAFSPHFESLWLTHLPLNVNDKPGSDEAPSIIADSLTIDVDPRPLIGIKTDLRHINELIERHRNENETVVKISDVDFTAIERMLDHLKYLENLIEQKKKVEEAAAAVAQSKKEAEALAEERDASKKESINQEETINLAEAIVQIYQTVQLLQEQVQDLNRQQAEESKNENIGNVMKEMEVNNETSKLKNGTATTVSVAENSSELSQKKKKPCNPVKGKGKNKEMKSESVKSESISTM